MTAASGAAYSVASGPQDCQPGQRRQRPPKAIQLLLPLWGRRFIAQFLRVSLPTLLAPGNLPSIAHMLPCKLIFLTGSEDAEVLRNHPAVHYLQDVCEVEFRIIDDLITGDNYSTTITLAYAHAVRAAGAEMLDTCFFFLISDYIMADGSLANVMARIQAGYSGVVAGNFQVVEEDAQNSLFSEFDTGAPEIVLQARDLMRWAIKYLHPMTLANMVNFPLCHSTHSNRLFWRVDENTLIGHFYLMHMICIRPEVTNFEIGSSCDYSFIPEMCPSGNVHVLTDSDEYLVVEMQKGRHENHFVRLGSVELDVLIESLAEWTTATHRKNAHFAIVYHASDMPANLESLIVESGNYIDAIERRLPSPQPHRDHPYWLGAIAAHRWAISKRREGLNPLRASVRSPPPASGFRELLFRFRDFIFGRPPNVRPWHPRWPDYRMIMNLAREHLAGKAGHLLIISSTPDIFRDWLSDVSRSVVSLDLSRVLNFDNDQLRPLIGSFEGCLLVLRETEIPHAQEMIAMIKSFLNVNDCLLIFALNGHGVAVGSRFSEDLLSEITLFFDPDMSLDNIQFMPAGWVTWVALRGMRSAFLLVTKSRRWLPFAALATGFLIFVSLFCNLGRRGARVLPRNEICSSLGLVMRKTTELSLAPSASEIQPLELAAQRFSKGRSRVLSAGRVGQAEPR